eukprot:1637129-Rhodomonas_salina.2
MLVGSYQELACYGGSVEGVWGGGGSDVTETRTPTMHTRRTAERTQCAQHTRTHRHRHRHRHTDYSLRAREEESKRRERRREATVMDVTPLSLRGESRREWVGVHRRA